MTVETRKYRQKKRAEQQQETRLRIVEAAVALHREVGPRETSIKAVAERAGVERLTVYRHFPDQIALFHACTTHWLESNPLPERALWQPVEDWQERARILLNALYAYYRRNSRMWHLSWRDRHDVIALRKPMAAIDAYLDGLRDDLASPGAHPEFRAVAGHLLGFPAWQSMHGEGLNDPAMAELAIAWLNALCRSES